MIVIDVPPLWDEIDAAFKVAGKSVVFSWGDKIFNPQDVDIPPEIIVHEAVHGERQLSDIVGWWHRYIDEQQFRFDEELLAHQAEYNFLAEQSYNRHMRRTALKHVAQKLASPLYGKMVNKERARAMLRRGRLKI
jgi:hypothetical protein